MYCNTQHMIESLYFNRAKNVQVAMLTLYVDDSGTGPTQGVAVAAGWIAPTHSWNLFDRDWQRLQNGVDKFNCMHMAEFVGGHGEFVGWGLDKKRRLATNMRTLIKKRARKGFALAVTKTDFDQSVPAQLRALGFENHYTYAVRRVMGMIHEWRIQEKLMNEPIEYIFDFMDKHDPRRREIERVFEVIGDPNGNFDYYGVQEEPIFRNKKAIPPLQAADVLAWTVYNAVAKDVENKNLNPLAVESAKDFVSHMKGQKKLLEGGYHTPDQVVNWVKSKGF